MALHVLQYSDVENAFDAPERVARLAGEIERRREDLVAREECVLVVGTGDVFGPGVLSLVTEGEHALSLFDAVDPVAETLGNHDFDHGAARTRELVREAPHEFLVANAYETPAPDASRFAADATAPWTVVDAGDASVGFVGVASPETATMAPGAESVDFRDPVPAVREAADALRDRGVDHVVVLAHLGESLGEELAAATTVDLVLDGHRHQPVADAFAGTGYARPGNGAHHIVHATLDPDGVALDARGDATDGTIVSVAAQSDTDANPDASTDTNPDASTHANPDASTHANPAASAEGVAVQVVETATAPVHAGLEASLRDVFDAHDLTAVLATSDDPVDCAKGAVQCGESRVGNLVVDAYRWATNADVAIMAPGGIRTREPLAGDVTRGDLVGLVPFDDDLVSCVVDGETLRAVLASTTMHRYLDDPTRKFGHVSGVEIVWDDVDAAFESIHVDGDPIATEESYRLAATDYFVETNHLYPALEPAAVVERHGPHYEALIEYAKGDGIDPSIDGRIVRPRYAELESQLANSREDAD